MQIYEMEICDTCTYMKRRYVRHIHIYEEINMYEGVCFINIITKMYEVQLATPDQRHKVAQTNHFKVIQRSFCELGFRYLSVICGDKLQSRRSFLLSQHRLILTQYHLTCFSILNKKKVVTIYKLSAISCLSLLIYIMVLKMPASTPMLPLHTKIYLRIALFYFAISLSPLSHE